MSARKSTATFAVLIAGTCGVLALTGARALGAVGHRELPSFGPVAAPSNVAVDQSTGVVFVAAVGEGVVDEFKPTGSGEYELVGRLTGSEAPHPFVFHASEPAPVAVDSSTGDIYVVDPGHFLVDEFNAEGKYICQLSGVGRGCLPNAESELGSAPTFGELTGVNVDSHGNVYVSDYTNEVVDEFTAAGGDVGQIRGGGIANPSGVAVDSTGVVYVQNYFADSGVVKLTVNAKDEVVSHSLLDPAKAYDVAVDPMTNDIYVDHGSTISVYGPEGKLLTGFATGANESEGVAFDGAAHELYVTDRIGGGGHVAVFEAAVVPDVSKCEAIVTSPTSATLIGEVNPDKTDAEFFFQYGVSKLYGLQTPLTSVGVGNEGESYVAVEAAVTGLVTGTTYHCRLSATNGTSLVNEEGEDGTFTTPAAVKLSTGTAAHNNTGTSATLTGNVTPKGRPTTCFFEYGSTNAYGAQTTPETVETEEEVTAPISGLEPIVEYHYRLVCENELGTSYGADEILVTPPVLPTVNDRAPFATEVALHEATLHGTINPGKGITEYRFVYGPAAGDYTGSAAVAYTPLNYQDDEVAQLIAGLEPGSVYHYALVATNATGTSTGPDETFSTISSATPEVQTGEASELSPSGVTLSGVIDPQERPASYVFELGTSSSYATKVYGSLSPGSGPESTVTAVFEGLSPGTTYHYRLVASNVAGVAFGADRTFTTSVGESPLSAPVAPLLIPAPPFPTVESVTSTHKSTVKKHKRVKHRKVAQKKTKRRRARRSKAGMGSALSHTERRAAR